MDTSLILDYVSWACLVAGGAFILIGALGIMRLPDMFSRMHGAGMIDTLGTGLVLLGLMIEAGFGIVLLKLILVGMFIYFTSPTSSHALARAAMNGGLKPYLGPKTKASNDATDGDVK